MNRRTVAMVMTVPIDQRLCGVAFILVGALGFLVAPLWAVQEVTFDATWKTVSFLVLDFAILTAYGGVGLLLQYEFREITFWAGLVLLSPLALAKIPWSTIAAIGVAIQLILYRRRMGHAST